MQATLTKGEGQLGDPELWLDVRLTKEQVNVLQDALHYSACQFADGGDVSQESVNFLRDLHAEIEKETGHNGRA